MNITTRKQFNELLKLMKTEDIKVVDTETNGLKSYGGNYIISLSVYFPAKNKVFNAAFRHGEGEVELSYTEKYPIGTHFDDATWQGKLKGQMYLSYWFNRFRTAAAYEKGDNYFQNLPIEWMEELKAVWGSGTYILHNSRFDAHMLYASGFPDMEKVYDTMIALHIVNEDWRQTQVNAPYTYTRTDAPTPEQVGLWAQDEHGNLLKKRQYGNRSLKWQCAYQGFEDATAGEASLFTAIRTLEAELVDFIMENIHEPINDKLLLAAVKKGKATPVDMLKQREKIAAKVKLDNKANLWMLPSSYVSYYAELDVLLTWKLYETLMPVIAGWNNTELWEKQSLIHQFVAWEMERNGFKLDVREAQKQIDLLKPRIAEVEDLLQRLATEWTAIENFNPNSPQNLLKFLNSGILTHPYDATIFPEWWDTNLALGLKTYPDIYIRASDIDETTAFGDDGVGDGLVSTDKRELEKAEDHAVVRLIKELRRMNKSVKTYLQKWIKAADENGIVRFTVNDDGTVSGRASSSGDAGNGQNIPDRNGYTIKRAVVPYDQNWKLIAIDYGQLELRLGAWIAENQLGFDTNKTMTNLFLTGADMHSYVRDMINIRDILFYNMSDEQIVTKIGYKGEDPKIATPELRLKVVENYCRQAAKTMNFGLLYSGGAPMLSRLLKIDTDAANVLVKSWRTLFPAFAATQEYITQQALIQRPRPDGEKPYMQYFTQYISGRHRKLHQYPVAHTYVEDGETRTFSPREVAARKVWNNTVQGLGGYIAMWSAYRIGQELGRDNIRMFVNIHDALEMYVHTTALHLVPAMGEIMVDFPTITPALTVSFSGSIDGTWQGMTEIKDMDKWIATEGKKGY